ncbi:hypothetical protein NMG60_11012654 [Bertholletia excelsa]
MGFVGSLERVNRYSRRQCRSLFWRIRAAVKKAAKGSGRRRLKFRYDPWSYALNFDDGCWEDPKGQSTHPHKAELEEEEELPVIPEIATWVWVLWLVESTQS